MNDSDKPFVCKDKNCNMSFANEDHLNSHQKKHSMSFNLELTAKSNEIAMGDQTPTPTSFFRNCEEVGLFQDLQNVNPFEETFKKALESSGSEDLKIGPPPIDIKEDSLHTPHIFPSFEEMSKPNKTEVNDTKYDLSISNFVDIPQITTKVERIAETDLNIKQKQENFRNKLKEVLLKKDKLKNIQNTNHNPAITLSTKTENLMITDNIYSTDENSINKRIGYSISEKTRCGNISIRSNDQSGLDKVREMNRAAQMRCRNKKKRNYDRLTAELGNLKKENIELKEENSRLKQNALNLWKIIEDLGGTRGTNIINEIKVTVITENKDKDKISNQNTTLKKLPILAPAANIANPEMVNTSAKPAVYSLVPVQVINSSPVVMNGLVPSTPVLSPEVKKRRNLPRILRKT